MPQTNRHQTGIVAVVALLCAWGVQAQVGQTVGPDVIVSELVGFTNDKPTPISGVIYDSFAVGTAACNRGNSPINWFNLGTDNRHPAITQSLFRYSNGRFEQIALSSVKHGFFADEEDACSSYLGFGCDATNTGRTLGIGCSDAYSAEMNNAAGSLGPRSEINATTGLFPYPYHADPSSGGIRARLSELNKSGGEESGTRYFVEAMYLAADDAAAGNAKNDTSWQEISVAFLGTPPNAIDFSTSGLDRKSVV